MSDHVHVIRLPNRFDFSQHKMFSQQTEQALAMPALQQLQIDFSQVQYLDSSALGMLVLLAKKAQNKSVKVSITGAQGTAQEILLMANIQKIYAMV